ncbi:MAG TPA: hypothetical protein ENF62_00470 [Candidatus Bathyarchaeota archaeon]|nr:hypothetical protein [Candidatus Bathyarchaeota archaeon]
MSNIDIKGATLTGKNEKLKTLPKIRQLLEEVIETIEILTDRELMKSVRESEKDLRERRTLTYKQLLEELDINEKEI